MLVKSTIELILRKKIVEILVFRSKFGFFMLKFSFKGYNFGFGF